MEETNPLKRLAFPTEPARRQWLFFAGLLLAAVLLIGAVGLLRSPSASAYSADLPIAWFDLALELIRETPGFSPPVAARALGYLGVVLYESVQPGIPGNRTLAGQLNELDGIPRPDNFTRYHWPTAANAALASLTRKLFPGASTSHLAAINLLEESNAQRYMTETDLTTFRRSEAWGRAVADAIYAWSLTDGGHEGYLRNFPDTYTPPAGAGLWEPTPPDFSRALQPYWGANRPFVLPAGDACPAPPPPPYSEESDSQFYREAMEVYTIGQSHTPEQLEIALFWADDPVRTATPPGHWISILSQVLAQEEATLDVAAEAYAKLGIALADAFITCWQTKYVYNLVRPITYIQQVIDPTWNTPEISDPVSTPPFPEYTSGHSVQSGAAALVLASLFGDEYAFTDHTHDRLGLAPRSFNSFEEAANEAAVSRIYGGIHYRSAVEEGLAQGKCVGERVLALRFR